MFCLYFNLNILNNTFFKKEARIEEALNATRVAVEEGIDYNAATGIVNPSKVIRSGFKKLDFGL
ncbi:hypothetical protein [Paenibacillus sp. FSL R10-2734]|uniref:hypothetical protein n=1 Tax=Paenibacillus sp. FSL R10-2734 TaxID=2954691 RepID=UPI0030DC7E15